MLRQAVQLAQDFGMFTSPRMGHHQWEKMSLRLQHACAITAWGLFILNAYDGIPDVNRPS